ncbi:MFS transporter [Donghicola mangrovi]|uniref:MFS transporter n=1 Tax=Donghicola mangrovi TaxID=2729614 RepID=A0A850QAY2_9RHOB|nr:MFS transporter [Donghicola mangrovi]NVO23439.1 MFS transporter [Donghicola mangrovi]
MRNEFSEGVFRTLAGADGPAADLSETAARAEGANGLRHTASLSMTKVADGLIDPKLVLSWLMQALGAPAVLVGMLVPIREAGALLPQLGLAAWVGRLRHKKWAWVVGSLGQGSAAAVIALVALTMEGGLAGGLICAALAVLAVSRAACSVSFKEILGKTVGKSRRGAVTGTAGSASSAAVLVFAGILIWQGSSQPLVIGAIGLAAVLWICAAGLFATLNEEPSETDDRGGMPRLSLLWEDRNFLRFIITRGLLVGTALAPPYLVVISERAELDQLGALIVASAAASLLSSYVWGRMSDRSSRKVLMLAGIVAAVALFAGIGLAQAGYGGVPYVMPAVLFILMIAYHGVRQGRSTYLVDMAPKDQKAAYAALANTVIGTLLLIAGIGGGLASLISAQAALAVFGAMSVGGAVAAYTLDEVE